ncbi:MAG: serine hydrolase [Clostridia bacterium]|nr:serine hydrolase [Clostridia bacterium]
MNLDKFIETATPLRALGVIVEENGYITGRHVWEAPCRRNIYSASKSFTSTAVGIAQREGLLSIDEKLTDAFKDDLPENVSPYLEKATVRDLLTMSLGQEKPFLMGTDRPYYEEKDWVKLTLAQEFGSYPGEKFLYNNAGPYLAGMLVQRRSGTDLVHYLMPRLFEPMGITLPTWETDPLGYTFGAGGLFLTLEELHRFTELYCNRGMWNGRQLVPAKWIEEATQKQVDNGSLGYGYLFWRGRNNSFRADGKYGQFGIVYPEKNACVTIVAESREADKLLKAVDEFIYPQF